MSEVNKYLTDRENSVALLQEPAHKKGKIISIDSSIRSYTGGPIGKDFIPRAAILVNSYQKIPGPRSKKNERILNFDIGRK